MNKKLLEQFFKEIAELTLLEQFFKEIAELTIDHNILSGNAIVFADKLGNALEKVDKEWWKKVLDNDVE